MATQTEEFLDVLKEQDKVDFIKGLIPAGSGSNYDPSVVMQEKGAITDIDDVVETGIYHGIDVSKSPIQGPIMVMSSQDSAGNMGFFLMGSDQILRVGSKPVGSPATWKTIASMGDLERPEVVSPYTATPTKDELLAAFKLLPHYVAGDATFKAEFWKGSHDFYVKDDPQTKMLLVKYRGVSNSTEATPGNFFYEKLSLAS
jgi:hypothetical protein